MLLNIKHFLTRDLQAVVVRIVSRQYVMVDG